MVILVSLPGVGLHPLGPLKLGGDGSYWSQILTTIPLHDKGKKLTFLQNLRVKRLSFSQKMVILVSLPGVGLHPLGPPKFGGDGSYGSQNLPTCPHHDIGKKLTCLQNHGVKRSSFRQKMIILVLIPVGGFTPPLQDPYNLMGMVLMGPKFCPQFSFMTKEKKLTLLQNLRVKR